jgi:hypothetical protein
MSMYWYNDEDKKIIGKKVMGFAKPFESGDSQITFMCDKGERFTLSCEGDCCSTSWFEHVELPSLPFTITAIEEVDGKDVLDEEVLKNHDVLKTYGLKMTTDKGHLDIDMRNDSNGYYGGSFEVDVSELT